MGHVTNRIKEYLRFTPLVLAVIFLFSILQNYSKINEAKRSIENSREKVEKLKEENERLKKEAEFLVSEEYLEKQLRDKLGLARDGEIVLVLPEDEVLRKLAPQIPEDDEVTFEANWEKWMKLFGL